VEGGPSRDFLRTKRLMHEDPETWAALLDALVDTSIAYLTAQVAAGAEALQVFDSWVGGLSPLDYERRLLPWMRRLFEGIAGLGVPLTHFGVGTAGILGLQARAGGDVIGLDWRIALADGRRLVGDRAVQGNLDPVLLLGPWEGVEETARWITEQNAGRPGHVFNLGHGVLPGTDPDQLARLVDLVHSQGASR
jgi:uroporphyrinogen decarboxylase